MHDSDWHSGLSAPYDPILRQRLNNRRRLQESWCTRACSALLLCVATAFALQAQTFRKLHNFDYTGGAEPMAALLQGTDGNLYGTTYEGGANGYTGTVFKITIGGTLTTLYSFCSQSNCGDGQWPYGALIQGIDGNFYGTTAYGGASNFYGTVFKITPSGTLTTLHSFDNSEGGYPLAGLLQTADGNLYGTTSDYGPNGDGTVFKITPSGALTTLYSFCSQPGCTDGRDPYAALVLGGDGNLYGTTVSGGAAGFCASSDGCGTVFKITPSGTLTTLHSFEGTDGAAPFAGLIQAPDGNLYGVAAYGGTNNACPTGCGTIFTITPGGTLTTLYNFCSQDGCTDGYLPYAGLTLGNDGNLYGSTEYGGDDGAGTAFKITPGGMRTTLYNFCSQSNCTDGGVPVAALIQDTNGKLYGTTPFGGAGFSCAPYACGTVFSLSASLRPFVETEPASAKIDRPIDVLGTNLNGATSVTFNGTAATFTVVSSSLITTAVPAGATTGTVQVVTPGGTLSSNVPFHVLQ